MALDVRFGSLADMTGLICDVCFAPESRHQAFVSTHAPNSKNLEAVLNALRRAGVEIEDDGLRLLKRRLVSK